MLKLQLLVMMALADIKTKRDNKRENDDRGATATEYGLLVAFIAFLIILGVTFFGSTLNDFFDKLGDSVALWNP